MSSAGADTLRLRDGAADDASCGTGADAVVADALDAAASSCETVTRA